MTKDWTGAGADTSYSTGGNWSGGVAPTAADMVAFVANPGTVSGGGNALYITIGPYGTAYAGTWTFSGGSIAVGGQPNLPYLPNAVGFFGNTVLNGETLNAAGGIAAIGGPGNVTVTAEGGSQVTTEGDMIGNAAGQAGALVLTGAGTAWTEQAGSAIGGNSPGFLVVGNAAGASGALTVTDNASLSTGSSAMLGNASGSSGTATVSAGGVWTLSGGATVGNSGSGSVTVNGGTLTSSALAVIGAGAGGSGTVSVTGLGLLTNAGGLDVGGAGTGSLLVQNGGFVASGGASNSGPGLEIGRNAGGSGSVTVAGVNSLLTNNGEFVVGDAGTGSLAVENDATVVSSPGSAVPAAVIASQAGSDGSSVTVTGTGSDWQVGGTLQVGSAAHGGLAIAAGGVVSAASLDAGVQGGGTLAGSGDISLSGSGSRLQVGGLATVGDAGLASMSIYNGATFAATDLVVGNQASGSGNIDLQGTLSFLDATGTLSVGVGGAGVVTVGADTTLAAGTIHVGSGGLLFNEGGTVDPTALQVDPGGTSGGAGTFVYGAITNDGTFITSVGKKTTLTADTITADPGDNGILQVNQGSDLILTAGMVDTTQVVQFVGSGSTGDTLEIGHLAGWAPASISNFTGNDKIIVDTAQTAAFLYSGGTVVSVVQAGNAIGSLVFDNAAHASAAFNTAGALVDNVTCFAAGTRIRTAHGEVAVEDLREGDQVWSVLTRNFAPVRWIGFRAVNCRAHPQPAKVWPVVVSAGAFGPGLPARDLMLSPDHALYLDEVLIPVKLLTNGATIRQTRTDTVTYFHVELPEHDVLLAEGLAAESYLDVDDRSSFANGAAAVALHPDFAAHRWKLRWEAEACAPLYVVGPQVEAARAKAAALAAGSGPVAA